MRKTFLMILFCMIYTSLIFAEEYVISLPYAMKEDALKMKYDIAAMKKNDYIDLIVSEKDLPYLLEKGGVIKTTGSEQKKQTDGYMTYEEIRDFLEETCNNNPNIAKFYNLGASLGKIYYEEGLDNYALYQHDIMAIKISDNVDIEEDEAAYFFIGNHHAREPISREMVVRIIQYLINNYNADSEVTDLVNNREIWLIPSVNPNGTKIVVNPESGYGYEFWRKNIRDNDGNGYLTPSASSAGSTDGVDVNRNYDLMWGTEGASHNNFDADYCGTEAFSEPETRIIRDFFNSKKFVGGVSYHSYSEAVLYPFGYSNDAFVPDYAAISELANNLATLTPSINGYGTYNAASSLGYFVSGGESDYSYAENRTFAFVIEMGIEFIPPIEMAHSICDDNMNAVLYLLKRSDYSTLTGIVSDNISKDVLGANIKIKELDLELNPNVKSQKSDANTGRFYRILTPGEYTLVVDKYGYARQEIPFIINEDSQTEVNVQLENADVFTYSGRLVNLRNNLPIPNVEINIRFLDSDVSDNIFTDANGGFEFETLPENIRMEVVSEEYASSVFQKYISAEDSSADYYTFSFSDDDEYVLSPDNPMVTFSGDWEWGMPFEGFGTNYGDFCWGTNVDENNYANNTYSELIIDCSDKIRLTEDSKLYFYQKYNIQKLYDGGNIKISTDNGNSFSILTPNPNYNGSLSLGPMQGENVFTDKNDNWELVEVDLSEYNNLSPIIKFDFYANYYLSYSGWYIDDIFISGDRIETISDISKFKHNIEIVPNPFNPTTAIKFFVQEKSAKIELSIFNVKGEKIREISKIYYEGEQTFLWNGKDEQNRELASGIYFVKISTGKYNYTKKMLLIK